jgi:hypothetical protein
MTINYTTNDEGISPLWHDKMHKPRRRYALHISWRVGCELLFLKPRPSGLISGSPATDLEKKFNFSPTTNNQTPPSPPSLSLQGGKHES